MRDGQKRGVGSMSLELGARKSSDFVCFGLLSLDDKVVLYCIKLLWLLLWCRGDRGTIGYNIFLTLLTPFVAGF